MSFKRYRIIFILIFMLTSGAFGDHQTTKQHVTNDRENAQSDIKEARALFPRAEYTNEWQPVGRGDPLKDPTLIYMPPVLERVRYWGDGAHKNKNDILLLGVPSKKLSSIKQKDKFSYGPIKRTYYSPPYQHHFSSAHHHQQQHHQQQQQQQHLPQHRLMPPPKHATDSYPMSTHHYQHHQYHDWKTPNNVYTEPRPENSINHMKFSRPNVTPTTATRHPSSAPFLPTVPPSDQSHDPSSTSPTSPMSAQTSVKLDGPTINGHMMLRVENSHVQTTKPLLQSILQTETASPFTKTPSSAYQIEYTSNIYSPEDINSMAHGAVSFVPTKPTVRPMSMKTTMKTSLMSSPSTSTAATTDKEMLYLKPEMHAGWPVYNLIIEGHSKVKTYGHGLKNDDDSFPKIRPVQAMTNPVVRVTQSDEGPEFNDVKRLQAHKKDHKKKADEKKSTMTSLLSMFDSSFGNFLSAESVDKVRHESENSLVKSGNSEKRKTRRSIPDDKKHEQVFSVSFQVDDEKAGEQPQTYRKGTVISEKLWPFGTSDESR